MTSKGNSRWLLTFLITTLLISSSLALITADFTSDELPQHGEIIQNDDDTWELGEGVVLEPSSHEDSYYEVKQPLELESLEVHSDGILFNGEKFRALPENGEVDVGFKEWNADNRKFTASASDTVVFEFENLEPYTAYSIYHGDDLEKYVSTDSEGYLEFEHEDWSEHEFEIQDAGVNVITKEPTDITSNSAVFHGEVVEMGDQDELDAYFRYRETDEDEWEETECQSITTPTEYDENVSGLSPGTSYEYKAVAEWDDGEKKGEIVSFTTDFETDPYDWQGFLDPEDGDVIYKEDFPADLLTVVDSVPDSGDDDNGTTLDYWGEFYIDDEFDGEKELNSEPNYTEYIYEDLGKGTYDLKVEWHYDLGFIEEDEITVTIKESEPDFELSNLQVNPKEMYIGTEMTAEVDVENVGSETGDYTAEFYKDNYKIGSDTVTVEPGQTETATIEHTVTDSGTYDISVEDLVEEIVVYKNPDVETDPATNINTDSAKLHGEVVEIGMEDDITAYFRYRETGDSTWIETSQQTVPGEKSFDELVDDLNGETEYEFKAVIEWDQQESVGEVLTFITLGEDPVVETEEAVDIYTDSATLQGTITDLGDYDEVNAYFRWREEDSDEWIETPDQSITEPSVFEEDITGLDDNTVHEFKAVVEWNDEEDTGEIETFQTLKVASFELSNLVVDPDEVYIGENFDLEVDVENIGDVEGEYTAEFYMENEKIGEDTVVVPGGETKTASVTHSTDEADTYEVSVEDLTEEVTVSDFPEVKTEPASDITTDSAELHADVTYLGLEDELDAYFNYRVQGEEWESTPAEKITELGEFSHELTDLKSNTSYEFEAVIEWNSGEEKGETLTFTTEKGIPDVETVKATDVTESSAVLVGEVTEMGDYDEVEVFFRLREKGQEDWIESHEPELITEEGEFDELWSNLAPSTAYEFKAVLEYNGVVIGDIHDFGTDSENLLVETRPARDVKPTSALLLGELLGLGDNDEVEVSFEYKQEFERRWRKTESETRSETGEFVKEIDGLEPDTTYQFRAVAEGEAIEKGETKTFETPPLVSIHIEEPVGEGTVKVNGEEVTEWPYEEDYKKYTEIEIKAIPEDGWRFGDWRRDVPDYLDGREITLTMDRDKDITINFEKEPNPVHFEVEITDYDDEVEVGENITVEYTVVNTADVEGIQDVVFTVNGTEADIDENIRIQGGENDTGEFTWEVMDEGEYEFGVLSYDDEDNISVKVEEDDGFIPLPVFPPSLLLLGIGIAVIIYKSKK